VWVSIARLIVCGDGAVGGDTYDGSGGAANSVPGLLDYNWGNGYKNDVWTMKGTVWQVEGDIRLRTDFGQKIPQVRSTLRWNQETAGIIPPIGVTYDNYTVCETYFKQNDKYKAARKQYCSEDDGQDARQWSPRRFFGGVYFGVRRIPVMLRFIACVLWSTRHVLF
jgi:hypothetical protein